jgi:hypothetical protein
MNEQTTNYTVKSKNSDNVWTFKYDLNGLLLEFKRLEGILSDNQVQWFFFKGHFPYKEVQIKEWIGKLKVNFEITIGTPDLSFEALWNLYDNKVKKFECEKSFKKLKEADIIKCFLAIPGYNKYLQRKGVAKAHLSTFINQRYFEDDWSKA